MSESLSLYEQVANKIDGQPFAFGDLKGKAVLVVNTASQCGFTPQFTGLEELHRKYQDRGLVVLGFPCNQFGQQDPGANEEIASFCQKNYGVSFTMMQKVDVNGENTHPVFKFLKAKAPGLLGTQAIKWNFTKFLVDKNGSVVERYAPTVKPEEIARDIEKIL